MSDKKQSDVKQPGWLRKVWLWVKRWWLPIVILLITSAGLVCALSIPQRVFETPSNLNDRDTSTSQNPGTPDNKETSHTIQSPSNSNNRNAPVLLAQSNLRLAFLYITGGAIAVMGLIETFRRNNNEKRKNDQEKEKNDRDHLRQVRAGRRERYTKAVEQLGDEKAPIRMGGVYTLVGLIDEWLEDESIKKYEDRLKEGQVIINNLCAYIRSPFTLASYYDKLSKPSPTPKGIYKGKKEKFYADKATLESEADVRLSIIKEIHDRLQGPEENTPGTWSDFEYDFSGSTFFYPVDLTKSYYKKPVNFSGSTYEGWADFHGSTYKGRADFHGSTYQGEVYFHGSTYQGEVYFHGSTYKGRADFHGSTYQGEVYFYRSTYQGEVYFHGSTYTGWADFGESTYEKNVIFSTFASRSAYEGGADFSHSTYEGRADFHGSTYKGRADFHGSTYQGRADFRRSTYKGRADFHGSTYQGRADFRRSTYQEEAYFNNSTYQGGAYFSRSTCNDVADFSGSIFYQKVYFGADGDNGSFSRFTDCAPQFYDETNHKNTLFGSHNNDFTVDIDKGYPIDLDSKGIPLNCKFLTSEQKEYLADNFQEIDETKNKLREVKEPKEKEELSKKLQALNEKLHEWREEATTVKVEDGAIENTES